VKEKSTNDYFYQNGFFYTNGVKKKFLFISNYLIYSAE